jgi:negative regulator of flagellin synthesis FlgM
VANTINSFQGNGATSVTTSRPQQSQQSQRDNTAATTTGNSESGSSAEVQITSTASQLASLGQQLSTMPAVDSARVGRISQSLADGTYTISPDKIASGLMQSDHALAQIGMQES